MSFLFPAAFGLLALTPVVVLLYLLKQKRRPAGVPTLMFWHRIVGESKRRVLFRRLRQWLSLLLHLLILSLLILAVAKPEWGRRAEEATVTVLVVDARARMQAASSELGEVSRFTEAVEAAIRAAQIASPTNPAMIVVAQRSPYVAASLSGDERALVQSLEKLRCSDGGGDLRQAVQLAADLLESQPGLKKIQVFTDERHDGELLAEGTKADIQVQTIGRPLDNVGVTKLAARALLNSPQTAEIMLELSNYRQSAWEGEVELYMDDRVFDVRPVRIPAGQTTIEVYPATASKSSFVNTRGWLTAKITQADAFPLDNSAYAVLPSVAPKRILLVSEGNLFLERLLEADPAWRFELLKPAAFDPKVAGSFDVVVFDGVIPDGFDPAKNPGGYLFLNKHPYSTGDEEMTAPVVTGMDKQSPLLRLVRMDEVNFSKAKVWNLDETGLKGWKSNVVLQSVERPLVVSAESESGSRFVALAFHPLDTDLPMRVAYPLLVSNMVNWLSERTPPIARSLAAGEFLELPAGSKVWTQPQRKVEPLAAIPEEEWTSLGFVPETNGYYLVRGKEGDSWIAVNTGDAAMSDLRDTGVAGAGATQASPVESNVLRRATAAWRLAFSGQWPLWLYLALGAFLLLALEWGWFHRRKTE